MGAVALVFGTCLRRNITVFLDFFKPDFLGSLNLYCLKGKLAEWNCTTEPTASYSKIVKIIVDLIIIYPRNWNFYSLTTFLNMTMLPAHQGVHGVAPGGVLYPPTIPAHRADTINLK